MHILPLLGYLSLLTTSAVLLVAFLRVQRTNRDLTDQLSQAREQQLVGAPVGEFGAGAMKTSRQ